VTTNGVCAVAAALAIACIAEPAAYPPGSAELRLVGRTARLGFRQ